MPEGAAKCRRSSHGEVSTSFVAWPIPRKLQGSSWRGDVCLQLQSCTSGSSENRVGSCGAGSSLCLVCQGEGATRIKVCRRLFEKHRWRWRCSKYYKLDANISAPLG
jgi:hypothetical protein